MPRCGSRRTYRGPRTSSARHATSARVVFDASALVRAISIGEPRAVAWFERVARAEAVAFVPDLIYAEVGHALAVYVRAGELTRDDARARMELVTELPTTVHSSRSLAPSALEFALTLGTTVYDACYLVVAELRDCLLVTADRRLAAAAASSELLP